MGLRQYHQSFDPFSGLAQSIVTGNPLYSGDAAAASFSIVTSSATASRWTVLGYDGLNAQAGFMTALPPVDTNNWNPIKAVSAAGYGSFDTLSKWCVFLRTPSASSTTISVTFHVGP